MSGFALSPAARNPRLEAFVCLRCAASHPIGDYPGGCPRCLRDGSPANVAAKYSPAEPGSPEPGESVAKQRVNLPYLLPVSLGEGATPIVDCPHMAAALGVGKLSVKLEWCNPTGSHKDRMSAQLMARARDRGCKGVIAASSGNAGVSVSAYAAAAGLTSEIVITPSVPAHYCDAMLAYGARLTSVPDSLARWRHIASRVETAGVFAATNYHVPSVGSDPFGVEGYKNLAAEIALDGEMPDTIVVPTARGDLLSGLYLGFAEIGYACPRLVAVEPFPRLARVMAGEDYRGFFPGETCQTSIAGPTVTYQAIHALQQTLGTVVVVDDDLARAARHRLAKAGFYPELAAAATLAAAQALVAEAMLAQDSHVLLVLTASGFRDPSPLAIDAGNMARDSVPPGPRQDDRRQPPISESI